VCTYFQPIKLVNRGTIGGAGPHYAWDIETGSSPITGEAAVGLVPRFRWEYIPGTIVQTLFGLATHSGHNQAVQHSASSSPGTNPQPLLTVRWQGTVRRWATQESWYTPVGAQWYPFVGFESGPSSVHLPSWPIELAGDYLVTHDQVTVGSSTIHIYIDPSRTAVANGGSLLRVKHGTDYGKPFKWLTLEVREWSYGESGSLPSTEEIVDELQDIETILQAMNVRDSAWYEAWDIQNTNLMQWKTDWVSQDEWLRPVLEAIKESSEDDDTSPTLPIMSEIVSPSEPQPIQGMVGGIQTTLGDVVTKPKLFSVGDDEADNTTAPTWTFVLPINALQSIGGPAMGNRTLTVDFSAVPNFGAVRLLMFSVWYLWAAIWAVSHIWEEFRKY
jgi:hypothetical protein